MNGQRGNPILLDEAALAEIVTSDTNLACRQLIDNKPELVHSYETANSHFISDLDTLDDVQELAERTGWRLEMPAQEVDEQTEELQMPVALSSH